MADRTHKILIVEPDADILEVLVDSLTRRFDAYITCVVTAEACLDLELAEPHDLVIAELNLEGDEDGLHLAERLSSLSARPIILLGDEPSCEDALSALRLGVHDMLIKPFPIPDLLEAAERSLEGYEVRRQHQARYRHMRELVRRVIRERRALHQRIELICRDLVGAHRKLVHRVLEYEESRGNKLSFGD